MADENEEKEQRDPEAEIEELKKSLAEADKRAHDAEQRVRRSASEVAAAGERVQQSELQIVTTAIETLTAQGASFESQYEVAAAEGNHRLMGSLARQMAKTESQLTALEAGKQRLEMEAAEPKRPQVLRPVEGEAPAEFLAKQLPPRAASWIRRNPEYAQGRLYNKMLAAHNLWISDNPGTEETDEYFSAVEATLGFVGGKPPMRAAANGKDHSETALSAAASGTTRGAKDTPPPAAPASRGGGGNSVRLNAEQREAAAVAGVSEEEYARNLTDLRKDGRLKH